MSGPRVVLLYEDKTAGGLHRLVHAMARRERHRIGAPPFAYIKDLPMKGNSKLIEECRSYERMRFFGPHRADHVFAVIDGYGVERVVPGVSAPPLRDAADDVFDRYCSALTAQVCSHLRDRALAGISPEQRSLEEARFHPHVLLWERESVFLAGGATLQRRRGLFFPEETLTTRGVLRARHPTPIVESAWEAARGTRYSKAVNGPQLFEELVQDDARWPELLAKLPSLAALVQALIAL